MDFRSFDLNCELSAVVYDNVFSGLLANVFERDTKDTLAD